MNEILNKTIQAFHIEDCGFCIIVDNKLYTFLMDMVCSTLSYEIIVPLKEKIVGEKIISWKITNMNRGTDYKYLSFIFENRCEGLILFRREIKGEFSGSFEQAP